MSQTNYFRTEVDTTHLPGTRTDTGQEATGGHLLVQKRVQGAGCLALGQLTLYVVGLSHLLQKA